MSATSKQVRELSRKLEKLLPWEPEYALIRREIAQQRASNIRKKRELAVIAGQEIAYISHVWDNAVVVFEDLSWVENTMRNGRWNRGELLRRTRDFVELNGSRLITVNAAYSSRRCYQCGESLTFMDYHTVVCSSHGVADRDGNAAGVIANRGWAIVGKMVETRRRSRRFGEDRGSRVLRTPVTGVSRRGRGVSRRKVGATGRCENRKRGRQFRRARRCFGEEVCEVLCSTGTRCDDVTVLSDVQQSKCCVQDPRKAATCVVVEVSFAGDCSLLGG